MRSTVKRLAVLGALGTTLGIVAPVASASATGADFVPILPDDAAASGQVIAGPAVVGTIVLSAAPIWVVNASNQNSVGGNVAGAQVAAP
jgi:acyl dehydratase